MTTSATSTRRSVHAAAIVSSAALAALACAAPRESITFTSVDSNGGFLSAANSIRTAPFTGGYPVKSIRLGSTFHAVTASGSYRSDMLVLVTPSSGAPFILQHQLVTGAYTVTPTDVDLRLPVPTPISDAAGTWTFRFYESFDDTGTTGIDSVWDSVTFTLDDAPPPALTGTTAVGPSPYAEIEPNDSMWGNSTPVSAIIASGTGNSAGAGTYIPALAPGEAITGSSTGAETTTPGMASIDNFRIKAIGTTTQGIYRNRLTLSTVGAVGHSTSLRGFSQSDTGATGGAPVSGSDPGSSLQAGMVAGTTRINQWYSFGLGEEVQYRVSGTGSTAGQYTATLSREPVNPTPLTGPLISGPVSISRGVGNTNIIDAVLLDSSFNTVAHTHTSSSPITLATTLDAGRYYLAISNPTTANNLSSPITSQSRTNNVAASPGFVVNTSVTPVANLNMTFTDAAGVQTGAGAKPGAFDVMWYQIDVCSVVPCTATCGSTDFNHDGDTSTDADIEAFFACLAGDCCVTCDSSDFNGDGDSGTDCDIQAFFRVLSGGSCDCP